MAINLNSIELSVCAGRPDQFPRDGLYQIALSGRSNVGKSSLINTLTNRKRFARTSSSPGKTVTINFYGIDKKFYLVDLPGYGYAKRSGDEQNRFSRLTDAYLGGANVRFVLQLVDLKVGPTEDDYMMIEWLNSSGIPYAVVATKADKLNTTDRRANIEALCSHPLLNPPYVGSAIPVVAFSSLDGDGKDEIISIIMKNVK